MKKWLEKIFGAKKKSPYTVSNGSVETGRASYRFDQRHKKQRQNLLKKLNHFWSQRKERSRAAYQSAPAASGLRKILLAVCLLCAVVLFFSSGGFSIFSVFLKDIDYFRITEIRVQGCVNSTVDEIRNSSGVKVSSSLFAVDEQEISKNVKKESLWVDQVTLSRRWPDTLILQVHEYKPYALVAVGRGERAQLYYLDRKGNIFIKTNHTMDLDYPVITGLEDEVDPQEGPPQLQTPLDLLRLVDTNNPNLPVQSISEVHVDDEEGLIVYLVEHPFPIFFGEDDLRQKYYRLRKVLEMLYKPRKTGMEIGRVAYIKMDYLEDKVIVGYSES